MRLTRRFFLRSSGAVAAYCGLAPAALGDALARPTRTKPNRRLVVVFLRGGVDGLNLVVPYADPDYAKLRPSLALRPPGEDGGCLDLDGRFGLHPRATALMPWFKSGAAVALHAVGYPSNSRSHFEEQDVWETGVVGNTLGQDGWLNRHLQTSEGGGPLRAIAIGNTLPRILRGDAAAVCVRNLDRLPDLGPAGVVGALESAPDDLDTLAAMDLHVHADEASDRLREMTAGRTAAGQDAADRLADGGRETREAINLLRQVAGRPEPDAAAWPEHRLGQQMRTAARLLNGGVGVEVLEIDFGGWDTHRRQGDREGGEFGRKVEQLADSLHALAAALGDRLRDTLILTLSDFGRTAGQNGTRGTDHGWGNCMLAIGGGLLDRAGGQQPRPVLGRWPGLGPDALHDGRDLAHTTDFRDVIAEAVDHHLGNPALRTVLPGYAPRPTGLLAPA